MSLVVTAKTTFLSGLTCAPPIPAATTVRTTAAHVMASDRFMPSPFLSMSVPDDELGDGHAGPELLHELIRIELHADRVLVERRRQHPRLPLLGGRIVVDLQLDPVAVGIAIIHRRRGPMVHAEEGADPAVPDPRVVIQKLAHRPERERDVMQPRLIGRPDHQLAARLGIARRQWPEVEKRHPMMLIVVRHERQMLVLVHDPPPEHRAVPLPHLLQPIRLKHHMRKLCRWHGYSSFRSM